MKRSISIVIWIMTAKLLVGCETLQNSLSPREIANLRIDRVKVAFEPNAVVVWPKVEQAYVAALPPDKYKKQIDYTDDGDNVSGGVRQSLNTPPRPRRRKPKHICASGWRIRLRRD